MYQGYSFNRDVEQSARIFIEATNKYYLVHETGYIEGDTNAFVEGDFNIYELENEGDIGYNEVSNEELEKFYHPFGEPIIQTAVVLRGRKGRKAFNAMHKLHRTFRFRKQNWRVYKGKPTVYDERGFGTFGYTNNYKAIYFLVTVGAKTLMELIQEQLDFTEWENCDCENYDSGEY